MKLYTKPGACSTADHIALQWTGQPFDVQVMTAAEMKEPAYLAINPTGAVPAIVDGDFDSISARARAAIPAENLHPVAEQDSTDFEKCLSRIDAPLVLAIGYCGARQDHFLAALNTLARGIGPPCILIADQDIVTLCPPRIALDLAPGTRLSLFPMGLASGRATGLRWSIEGLDFAPAGRVGTSNAATGPVSIEMRGPMLLILPRAQLGLLARSLGQGA